MVKNIPTNNSTYFNKYLRKDIKIHEYTSLIKLNDALKRAPKSNSPRLEYFRDQLSRVNDIVELEYKVADAVSDVASKSGEYIGMVDVNIQAIKIDGIIHRHITCSNNRGVGIAHISTLFDVEPYKMTGLWKSLLPQSYITSYEASVTERIKDTFYDDKLISNINTTRIDKYIVESIGKLLSRNNNKTIKYNVTDPRSRS